MKKQPDIYNNMKTALRWLPGAIFLMVISVACSKDFLDAKPSQVLGIPTTINDFLLLLNNSQVFNARQPYEGEESADNYYIGSTYFLTRNVLDQNIYTWAPGDVYQGASIAEWNNAYSEVWYSNVILEGIDKVTATPLNQSDWNNVKGAALFSRAYTFYNLAQIFSRPYVQSSANTDPGLILRLSSDYTVATGRSSIQQSYNQIIQDLLLAKTLLPVKPAGNNTFLPSKTAALAMLARVYLSMQDYDNAYLYADSCLQLNKELMDYNAFAGSTDVYPIPFNNSETLYATYLSNTNMFPSYAGGGIPDSALLQSYAPNDLRRTLFFKTTGSRTYFSGTYLSLTGNNFNGLATDEVYLVRAECNARKGRLDSAMNDLDTLLTYRWKTGTFVPLKATSVDSALKMILAERRKELVYRATRWTDLRRLNLDAAYAVTIRRNINGQIYTLPPNDNRYTLPIPDNEILLSGVPQNPR